MDSFTFIRSEEFEVINTCIEVCWVTTPCSLEGGHQISDERSYSLAISPTYEGWNFNNGNYLFTTDTK